MCTHQTLMSIGLNIPMTGLTPNIGYDKKGRHLWTQDNGGTMYYDPEYTKKLLCNSGYILTFKPDDGKPTY